MRLAGAKDGKTWEVRCFHLACSKKAEDLLFHFLFAMRMQGQRRKIVPQSLNFLSRE